MVSPSMRRRREHLQIGKTACRQRESALCRLFDQEELAKEVLSWLTRWFGVASCRLVSKKFLSRCHQVEWASLILVTASRLNAIFVFGESGGLRQRIATTPWKRSSRLDPYAPLPAFRYFLIVKSGAARRRGAWRCSREARDRTHGGQLAWL